MARPAGLVANLLLAAASAAVALGGVEGTARIARRLQKGGKEQRTRLQYTEYDPLLGWRHTPGARARYERREYTTDVVVNSRGLVDRSVPTSAHRMRFACSRSATRSSKASACRSTTR